MSHFVLDSFQSSCPLGYNLCYVARCITVVLPYQYCGNPLDVFPNCRES